MQKQILKMISKSVKDLYNLDIDASIEKPKDLSMGDYTSNIAFILSKDLSKNPLLIAEEIVVKIKEVPLCPFLDEVIAVSGFINFKFSNFYFKNIVDQILFEKDKFGKSLIYRNKNILVEHSSPNLFKPFHIGHMMNNTIGESLTRLAKFSGAKVRTMSFPSDISLGIAKAIFVLLEEGGEISIDRFGSAYVEGTKKFEEDENVQKRVKEIADNLYTKKPSEEWELYKKCKDINIKYFENILKRLGTRIDSYIYESEAGLVGKKIVNENTPEIFEESEGAIVYVPDEERKDINTAVFINSQGNPTYEAKDVGLLKLKFDNYNPDISIFVTDVEQVPHFKVVLDAVKNINKSWVDKSVHIPHGRMSFKGQKMSSRLGGVPMIEDLLNILTEEVAQRSSKELDMETRDEISIASVKFSILKTAAGKNINFDPDTSLSFEGDSGPYLQYSAVRAKSVLEKYKKPLAEKIKDFLGIISEVELPEQWETTYLEKNLIHFPYIVERSIKEWSPHFLVTYLLELSQSFNAWYGNTKIIDSTNSVPYKIALTRAFLQVMHNGLNLLAIKIPKKM